MLEDGLYGRVVFAVRDLVHPCSSIAKTAYAMDGAEGRLGNDSSREESRTETYGVATQVMCPLLYFRLLAVLEALMGGLLVLAIFSLGTQPHRAPRGDLWRPPRNYG